MKKNIYCHEKKIFLVVKVIRCLPNSINWKDNFSQ